MADKITLNFQLGSHVLTMVDASGKAVPIIMLSWEEAELMVRMFHNPDCPKDNHQCMPCGLRLELLKIIAERGPKSGK